jgi:hypothetical protein
LKTVEVQFGHSPWEEKRGHDALLSPKIIKQNELNFGIHQLGEASDGWVSARYFAFFLREGTIGKLYGADRTVWKVARLPDLKNLISRVLPKCFSNCTRTKERAAQS